MLWELGWVEVTTDLLSLVPSLGMVADCIAVLMKVMGRSDNCVTHWCLFSAYFFP